MAFVELSCVPRESCFLHLQVVVEVEEKTTFFLYLFIRHCLSEFFCHHSQFRFADSGFQIPDFGFRIPDSGFRIPAFRVALLFAKWSVGLKNLSCQKRVKNESSTTLSRSVQKIA